MEESMKKLCPEETSTVSYDTGQFFEPHVKMRKRRDAKNYENDNGWWSSAFE